MNQRMRMLPAALALCLLLGGCGGNTGEYESEIRRLREENNSLTAQVQQLQTQLEELRSTRLESWSLDAWGAGAEELASVSFAARPAAYTEGQTAELLVMLDGREEARLPCKWNGDTFEGTLALMPQDGYGYYCVLTTPEGTAEQINLTTPDNPVRPKPVYLKSSLESYVSALVSNQRSEGGEMILDLTVSVQLPLLTADGTPVTVNECTVSWVLDGQTLGSGSLGLTEGETEGSLSGFAGGLRQQCPNLEAGQTLCLTVSARLSDGRTLTAEAANWTGTDGGLENAVG